MANSKTNRTKPMSMHLFQSTSWNFNIIEAIKKHNRLNNYQQKKYLKTATIKTGEQQLERTKQNEKTKYSGVCLKSFATNTQLKERIE